MLDRQAVYQRTDLGRQEIRHKSHGLTQSERLILILVDGVGELRTIRGRLQGLTDERFDRAVRKLLASHLIEQVLLQVDSPIHEEIDEEIAKRFLRQDLLDPVTIISFEPEEDFPVSAAEIPTLPAMPAPIVSAINGDTVSSHVNNTASEVEKPVNFDAKVMASTNLGGHHPAPVYAGNMAMPLPSTSSPRAPAGVGSPENREETFAWYYWVGLLILSILTSITILIW